MKVVADRNAEVTPAAHRRIGGDAQILGDAVFWILMVAADEIELIPRVDHCPRSRGRLLYLHSECGIASRCHNQ